MHPKIAIRKQLDAAEATVKGLAEVRASIRRVEKKIDSLIRKLEVDHGSNESKR